MFNIIPPGEKISLPNFRPVKINSSVIARFENIPKVYTQGFTLIELLVTIAIVALLASVVLVEISNARKKSRDAKRLSDMEQIQKGLSLYFQQKNDRYPDPGSNDCSGWDVGNTTLTFLENRMTGIMGKVPTDPSGTGNCNGYRYYRYGAGTSGCDPKKGAFYVLGVIDMETSTGKHPDSPGWSCPSRNWQSEMEWVTGSFER